MDVVKKFGYLKSKPLQERVAYMNIFAGILELVLDLIPEEWATLHIMLSEQSQQIIEGKRSKH